MCVAEFTSQVRAGRDTRGKMPTEPSASRRREQREPSDVSGTQCYVLSQRVERVRAEIGRVLAPSARVCCGAFAEEDPAHVRPEAAVVRRVRVALVSEC
jgi:hypothetical protein